MQDDFFEEEPIEADSSSIAEYDITISPRDLTPASIVVDYLEQLFVSFVDSCSHLGEKAFFRNNRFSKSLFESVFYAVCVENYANRSTVVGRINKDSFTTIKKFN